MLKYVYIFCLLMVCYSCKEPDVPAELPKNNSLQGAGLPVRPLPPGKAQQLSNIILNYFKTRLINTGFNGQMLVAYKGNILFEAYAGMVKIRGKDTIKAHTPFHIASTTKTFTAMAVLKLVQDGKLALQDPFAKYFPEFPYKEVTIKTLLNHRSGLPNYTHFLEMTGWNKNITLSNKDVLTEVIKHPELVGRANRSFMYCNTNYALLALLIEKITGKPYPTYLKEIFFDPLGMNDTFVYTSADSPRITPSYTWFGRQEAFTYMDAVYGDKNIYSTVRDLYKWDQLLYTSALFTPATLDSAFTPYSFEKRGNKNYGLGWRMLLLPGGKKPIYHNGWWHGNNSTFYRLIQDSATIIILNNRFNRNTYHASELANLFGNYGMKKGDDNVSDNETVLFQPNKRSTHRQRSKTTVKKISKKRAKRH